MSGILLNALRTYMENIYAVYKLREYFGHECINVLYI